MFEKEIYINRRRKLIDSLSNGIALFLGNFESPMNYLDNTYHFRQDSSFLYFFGLNSPGLAAVVDIDNNLDYLFGNDADIDDIIWMGPQISIRKRADQVGVKLIAPFKELNSFIDKTIKEGRKIHFLPPYRGENMIRLEDLLGISPSKLGDYASVDLIKAVVNLRSIKEDVEITEIKKACAIGYEMHVTAMKMALPGVLEQKIAGIIEGIAISHGGNISFPVILSQNGETLHNHDHSNILREGRLMLTDAGAETKMGYASDFTRTVPVGGRFLQKQKEIYSIVLDANNHASTLIKPGVTYRSVHLSVAEVIVAGLKELGVMKGDVKEAVNSGAHALFMPHGLGHMMGLDVHDMEDLGQNYVGFDDETKPSQQFGLASLRMGRKLQKGFVITNEPGIYFIPALIDKWQREKINESFINFEMVNRYRDFGGIRLEDNIVVTEEGGELLGQRVPISIEDVENTICDS